MSPIGSTGFAAIHYGCAPVGILTGKRRPGVAARTAVEDQTIRFHNAVNLNDVLLVTELAGVRKRFHCGLTPFVSRMEDDGGAVLVTRGSETAAESIALSRVE